MQTPTTDRVLPAAKMPRCPPASRAICCPFGQGSPAVAPSLVKDTQAWAGISGPSHGLRHGQPSRGREALRVRLSPSPGAPYLGPEVCYCPGWLQVAPTLPGCSAGVQACRQAPGRFRVRLVSVRGRLRSSLTAEESRLSLVEGRGSGLQQVFSTWLPSSSRIWGVGRTPRQCFRGREGSSSRYVRGVVEGVEPGWWIC